jgi:hypothetical protein
MIENNIETILIQIVREVSPKIKHNDTVDQIEQIFRMNGFYTTREYPIFKMKDKPERTGRIDLVARKGKFRVAVEYDHHGLIKWKSFQKIVQIKPDTAIGITGNGDLEPNIERAREYLKYLTSELYIISLKERKYVCLE